MKQHLTYRFMPMVILSYLFINLYLVMTGSTWCKSEGCEVSKSLLNIEQTDLYSLAIVAFIVLLVIGLQILKTNSKKLKELFKFGLFTIMMCETILLSYLYFKTSTLCISCFIFYSLVVINFIILDTKSKTVFVIPFMIVAFAILDLDTNTKSNETLKSHYTLLQSPSCEHCKKVKEYLKENKIEYKKEEYTKYSGLFSSLNITKIPVMIVKNNDNNFLLLNGVTEILDYLDTNEMEKIVENMEEKSESHSSSNQISLDTKEGCEIDFFKNTLENCEE